MLWTAP
jgi:hypothetical protein